MSVLIDNHLDCNGVLTPLSHYLSLLVQARVKLYLRNRFKNEKSVLLMILISKWFVWALNRDLFSNNRVSTRSLFMMLYFII